MRNLFAIALLGLAATTLMSFDVKDEVTFARVDPLEKIFHESSYFAEWNDTVCVAAGEHATFQFAVRSSKQIKNLQMTLKNLKSADGAMLTDIEKGFVEYVHVGRKTPDRAKDAMIPLSNYYPDPILTYESMDVARDAAQPMWVTVAIPKDAKPGLYTGKFSVEGVVGGEYFILSRELSIRIYPVVLEEPTLWVTNWFSTSDEKMRIFNGGKPVERYSETYWNNVRQLAQKMRSCYQNVILISPLEHITFTEQGGKYGFDYTHFDQMIKIFEEEGVLKMIEGGHIAGREGLWDSPFVMTVPVVENGKTEMKHFRVDAPEAKRFYDQFIPALMQHLKAKGWDQHYSQHIADEPIASNIDSYVAIAKYIKQLAPNIKTIEACHSHDLANVLDIWVPQLNFYQEGYEFYTNRQKSGDEVWFYTCLAPQGDFANRFLEQPLIKTRLLHWINYRFGATGYLHWGFNQWYGDDPFRETTLMNTESGNTLPGGDGWIVYPKDGKLYGSIRLEAMRDGIADYTLLKMLEKKDAALAHELCRLVVFNWTLYDTESAHLGQIRKQILEALAN